MKNIIKVGFATLILLGSSFALAASNGGNSGGGGVRVGCTGKCK